MVNNPPVAPHRPRLNPFAFPSDTDLRFMMLVVTVLGASLFIYNWICLQMHFQDLRTSASCALHLEPKLKQALSALDVKAFQKAADAVRQCAIPYQRIKTAYNASSSRFGSDLLVFPVLEYLAWKTGTPESGGLTRTDGLFDRTLPRSSTCSPAVICLQSLQSNHHRARFWSRWAILRCSFWRISDAVFQGSSPLPGYCLA